MQPPWLQQIEINKKISKTEQKQRHEIYIIWLKLKFWKSSHKFQKMCCEIYTKNGS